MHSNHWDRKRRIKCAVIAATVFFLLATIWLLFYDMKHREDLLHISIETALHEEEITCWQNTEEDYYVFLPGYTALADARIHLHTGNTLRIDDCVVYDGMSCAGFLFDTPYRLSYESFGRQKEGTITFLQSKGIPTMYIDTDSGSMGFIHDKKGNEESGQMRLYTQEGELHYDGLLQSINGRGNATWTDSEKKPYSISLSEEADLLGMGKAQKWILLANALDPSHLRNKIVYSFAEKVGLEHSPACQWVDLYLNGEYAGLYLLSERVEVHPQRVDLLENGSFLVSLELEDRLVKQKYPYIRTESGQALRVHYPIRQTDEEKQALQAQWQAIENAILADNGIDPVTGKSWLEQIDLDSWVRKYLIEEIFINVDAGLVSQYFYLDGSDDTGMVFSGPVWDYDISIGSDVVWELYNPRGFYANQLHESNGNNSYWFYCLYQKQAFYERTIELYKTEFLPALETLLQTDISSYAEQIARAAASNQLRWEEECTDFSAEVESIRNYMTERIAFLSSVWCENQTYCMVKAEHSYDCYLAVPYGECLTDLYMFEQNDNALFLGWYYKDTNEPFDITRPITEDIEIYAKWEETSSKKLGQILKLIPLGVIGIMGIILLLIDIKRTRNSR